MKSKVEELINDEIIQFTQFNSCRRTIYLCGVELLNDGYVSYRDDYSNNGSYYLMMEEQINYLYDELKPYMEIIEEQYTKKNWLGREVNKTKYKLKHVFTNEELEYLFKYISENYLNKMKEEEEKEFNNQHYPLIERISSLEKELKDMKILLNKLGRVK